MRSLPLHSKNRVSRIFNTSLVWVKAVVRMTRPLQLVAVTIVFLLGVVIAMSRGSNPDWRDVLWAYGLLILGSMSIHTANEYSDFETDLLTQRTMFSGGSGALSELGIPRRVALVAAWVWLLLTVVIALAALFFARLTFIPLLFLACGVFLGWMYSLPPFKFAWRGRGEALNAILGGMLLPLYGAAIIDANTVGLVLLSMIPFTLLAFNNLLATTFADRIADQLVGKFTLATRLPRARLRRIYSIVLLLSLSLSFAMPSSIMPSQVKLLSLMVIPVAFWGWMVYTRRKNPLPSVAAMIISLFAQVLGWSLSAHLIAI